MAEGLAALPAGDDARRPPRRARGLRPAAGRRASRSRRRPAPTSSPTPSPAPPASRAARAAAAPAPAYRLGRNRPGRRRDDVLRDRRDRLHRPPSRRAAARKREGDIHVLVREGSQERLDAAHRALGRRRARQARSSATCASRASASSDEQDRRAASGKVDHFFHLAAIYDMTADDEANERAQRRRHAQRRRARQRARGRHPAPRLVGRRRRRRTRACSARTCSTRARSCRRPTTARSSSPRRSRASRPRCPWRVYRPAIVVGHSQTGEMDKIDGPYYFFKAIQKAAPLRCRSGCRSSAPSSATRTSCRSTSSPRRWTTSPTSPASTARPSTSRTPSRSAPARSLNAFAKAAHAPQLAMRIDKRLTDALPKGTLSMLHEAAARCKDVRRTVLADFGIPEEVIEHVGVHRRSSTRATPSARSRARASRSRELDTYAEQAVGLLGAQRSTPTSTRTARSSAAINGRTVVITGASSGIGRATALKVAAAGGIPLLVARGAGEARGAARRRSRPPGGTAYVYSRRPLRHGRRSTTLVERILADHPAIDMLVNNAGRSIRRSIALSRGPLPRLRAHDAAQLLRRDQADHGAAAAHARARLRPHRQRLARSACRPTRRASAPTSPRRRRSTRGRASCRSEVIGDGITFTTIHMPLVRTPMIAPTKIYDHFPTITPDEAADLICEAMRAQAQADQHAPGHRSARSPTRSRRRPSTRSCTWPTRSSRTRPPRRARRTREREGVDGADRDGEHHEGRALVVGGGRLSPRIRPRAGMASGVTPWATTIPEVRAGRPRRRPDVQPAPAAQRDLAGDDLRVARTRGSASATTTTRSCS